MDNVATKIQIIVELFDSLSSNKKLAPNLERLLATGEFTGITRPSWNRRLATDFACLNKEGSGEWRAFLLLLVGLKCCSKCGLVQETGMFTRAPANKDGLHGHCKSCRSGEPPSPLHAEYKDLYRRENLAKYAAYSAKRRAALLQRTPSWADITRIQEFYAGTPKGCEVDHIIPLQGTLVSGLHVPENLQYLSISDNRSKGNKYAI